MTITETILAEVQRGTPPNDIAISYAAARAATGSDRPDWRRIDAAILSAHGAQGLSAIRFRASLIARGLIKPCRTLAPGAQRQLGLGAAAARAARARAFA